MLERFPKPSDPLPGPTMLQPTTTGGSRLSVLLLLATPFAAGVRGPAPPPQEVRFSSAGVELAGSILLPAGEGPFPGVVLVHGSGTSDRTNAWTTAYAGALVERGIAVLHPDKRGSGSSGGDWRQASFLTLADDALAAAARLRAHPRVAPDRVGVMGFSQGGQVVAAAAALDAQLAFAVSVSGSAVPILEQIGDEIGKLGEREGLGPSELAQVAALHELGLRYASSGQGWEAYATALAEARAGPMAGKEVVEGFPSEPDDWAWVFLRAIGDFDPLEHWIEVRVPVLFVFGGRDTQIRVPKSIDRIQRELGSRGTDHTILLFGKNGHALFRDDELDLVARWIEDRGEG